VYYCQQGETEYLITDEIPGYSSENELLKADIPGLLSVVAHALRRIHNLAINDFPLDGSVSTLLVKLERRISLNLLKPEDFRRAGWHGSPRELLDYMHRLRPQSEESVLTHGDYCLPNVLVKEGQVTGIVDWGYAGLGDRYRDFAAVVKSICRNLGEDWVDLFFEEYGVNELDREKLKYHRLLYDLT
jgi:aminoglycoside phosphotransferase